MTTTDNLWPEFSLDEVVRSPKMILTEQAEFLAKGTKNLLNANIKVTAFSDNSIIYYFEIVAPNLNGYKYNLFTLYQQDIFFYPLTLSRNEERYLINNEADLLEALKSVFSADLTKRIINSLIAQSKENEAPTINF